LAAVLDTGGEFVSVWEWDASRSGVERRLRGERGEGDS